MKLFTGIGPNPRVVTLFISESGAQVDLEEVDLIAGANREAAHLGRNPAGQLPTLQLDDGSYLAEITAICEYLDEKTDGPSLIGATPEERAETRMWVRRIDLNVIEPMANGFRYSEGLPLFQSRMRCIPEAAEGLKAIAKEKLLWLDGLMEGKDFICGDRFSLADLMLFAFLEFGATVGQPLDPKCERLQAWYSRIASRPSVAG